MPEKRRARGCGRRCTRCWENNLIHGNKLKLKQHPKKRMDDTSSDEDEPEIVENYFNTHLTSKEFTLEYHNYCQLRAGNAVFSYTSANLDEIYHNYCKWLSDKEKTTIKKKDFIKLLRYKFPNNKINSKTKNCNLYFSPYE